MVATGIADSLFTEIAEETLKEGDRVILGIETSEEQALRTVQVEIPHLAYAPSGTSIHAQT